MLPRPLPDPEYLRRLRAQALIRLQQEEQTVARRSLLQRIALIFAGLPFLRTKRALAVGPRCSAPQYGVPGHPGNPPAPAPTKFATRAELEDPATWAHLYGSSWIINSRASRRRTAYYKLPSGDPIPLNLITDGAAKVSYVTVGTSAFDIQYDSQIFGCIFGPVELILTPNIFKIAATSESEVMIRFLAEFDDRRLQRALTHPTATHISLAKNAPEGFWQNNGSGPMLATNPWIWDVSVKDDILQINCANALSNNSKSTIFRIDLKKMKLVTEDKLYTDEAA